MSSFSNDVPQSLRTRGVGTVEQVSGNGVGGILLLGSTLDIALLVLLDGLAHLDLLGMTLLGEELGPQAAQVLCILALLVTLTGSLLACALLGVHAYREASGRVLRIEIIG